MSRNKKVPLNCSSEGTSKLLLIGVKKTMQLFYTQKKLLFLVIILIVAFLITYEGVQHGKK